MKRLLLAMVTVGSYWTITPLVIGFFFLLYIGIAFFTDETLIALMSFTSKSLILAALLALIPLNSLFRILRETGTYLKIRRVLSGKKTDGMQEMFDDAVELPASPSIAELESRLAAVGYKTRRSENVLTAWRGVGLFPVRLLFLAGTFCLFTGILISITSRTSSRQMVIEGEPMPTPEGTGGMVERITLENSSGSILSRNLTMKVAPSGSGGEEKIFGLYPPSLYLGSFVYPRYLGIALHFRFSAPDMQSGYETHRTLNTYPPGKEDNVVIPGSPYRIVFSIQEPDAGSDSYISYMTGNITLKFKLMKEKEILFAGNAPVGGEFVRDGYRLALPDVRRLVVTDFVGDYGVFFIWWSALFFGAAACIWLPTRVFFPRREMLFRFEPDSTNACSRAEGKARRHAGVFHEALDLIDARKADG